jgi:tRNA U34 5-carboxymethylaminomethyl modifying GTPase MnmE/TrmE
MNKIDLGTLIQEKDVAGFISIKAQLNIRKGLKEIHNIIIERLGLIYSGQPHAVISERHNKILQKSYTDIKEALKILTSGQDESIVLAVSHLKFAIESLGQITGRTFYAELLNSIFSRFCVGK